jgi:ABC-type molybdate transport system substrate-binding protein
MSDFKQKPDSMKKKFSELIVFSAGGVAPPLTVLKRSFQARTGIAVKMYNGRPEELTAMIQKGERCDLLSLGAGFIADAMVSNGLLKESSVNMECSVNSALRQRKLIGWRDLALLTRRGSSFEGFDFSRLISCLSSGSNPLPKLSLASAGCLTGIWEMAALKHGPSSIDSIIAAKPAWATSCGELISHLVTGRADAILGWNTFAGFRDPDMFMSILPEAIQFRRPTIICSPVTCANQEGASAFVDHIFSEQGRIQYSQMGWTLPDWGVLATFDSATSVMKGERLLTDAELSVETIPTPRRFSSDCGSSILIHNTSAARVLFHLSEMKGFAKCHPVEIASIF